MSKHYMLYPSEVLSLYSPGIKDQFKLAAIPQRMGAAAIQYLLLLLITLRINLSSYFLLKVVEKYF